MVMPIGIPAEAEPLFRQLLDDEPVDHATLTSLLTEHVADISAQSGSDEPPNLKKALQLAAACRGLLDEAQRREGPDARRLVQAAVNYFIRNDDGDPDLTSAHGLDDDEAVCRAVARHLGRNDLFDEG